MQTDDLAFFLEQSTIASVKFSIGFSVTGVFYGIISDMICFKSHRSSSDKEKTMIIISYKYIGYMVILFLYVEALLHPRFIVFYSKGGI